MDSFLIMGGSAAILALLFLVGIKLEERGVIGKKA